MSDIYYCSNSKIKKSRETAIAAAEMRNSKREHSLKQSLSTSNNNNNNSNHNNNNNNNHHSKKHATDKDNNNLCGKHSSSSGGGGGGGGINIGSTATNAATTATAAAAVAAAATAAITNGKSNWKAIVQTNPNGLRDTAATIGEGSHQQQQTHSVSNSNSPQKVFHNTRCTRHHKSTHNHNHGGGGVGGGIDSDVPDLSHHHHHLSHSHSHAHTHAHAHSHRHSSSSNISAGGNSAPALRRKSESVLSTDSDIRFTRRKLGDSQKCGCAVIAGFLVALLVAGIFVYVGYTYFKPEPLPDRVFRGKFLVLNDKWTMELADQNSLRFQHKARDFRERINLTLRRSDLRDAYEGSEILALDGSDDTNDIVVHFNMVFDPYAGLVTTADLLALFTEEMTSPHRRFFANMTVDAQSLNIKETTGLIEEPIMSSSPLGGNDESTEIITTTPRPPRRCEPLKLSYCRGVGYNVTTYPNLLGHDSYEAVEAEVIAFRELVDGECFREAYDFVCRLLQPPCEGHGAHMEPTPGIMCREYCEQFMAGCGSRLPPRFKPYFDCESYPESTGTQSCHQKPHCANDMQSNAQSPRICDGYADCPDLSDERTCTFCSSTALYCGRGRACVPRKARCDGKADCPDGSDEKDCLSIAPLASDLLQPEPFLPYLSRFYSEGFAVFSEKGVVGKLCAEGLEGDAKLIVRQTVAESLCKSLGYESVEIYDVQNDTEVIADYVRVLDPHAPEISFIRTSCPRRQVLYVGCGELRCGVQSVLTNNKQYLSLPKMSSPGDWPWLVALFREDVHVCDGTLISRDWVLTTESCFQGQPRATWMAIFGSVRLSSRAPWTQRRRIIGMIKSPVEGSTAALVRLETSVNFSDHVRPICLPDELQRKQEQQIQRRTFVPVAERLQGRNAIVNNANRRLAKETQQFFVIPQSQEARRGDAAGDDDDDEDDDLTQQQQQQQRSSFDYISADGKVDVADAAASNMPRAESLTQTQSHEQLTLDSYPLPDQTPQVNYYQSPTSARAPKTAGAGVAKTPTTQPPAATQADIWTNCNTLGWSRQRDHLQRVQLKIGDMAPCENVSIATVNSMCTEATYQKYDCTQEEYSGAPVQCLIPGTNQWALIGVSSWRIACGPSGVERPRMYDKITSNAAWIHETMNAV